MLACRFLDATPVYGMELRQHAGICRRTKKGQRQGERIDLSAGPRIGAQKKADTEAEGSSRAGPVGTQKKASAEAENPDTGLGTPTGG